MHFTNNATTSKVDFSYQIYSCVKREPKESKYFAKKDILAMSIKFPSRNNM